MEAIKDFFTYLFLYPIIGVCAVLLYAVLLWILSNSINFLFNDIVVSKKNKTTEIGRAHV